MKEWLRKNSTRFVAILMIALLYGLSAKPSIAEKTKVQLGSSFSFQELPLPEVQNEIFHNNREVNPSLQHLQNWISSVGAAISLNDLDGDGLPDDVCHVDTRTNSVIVSPAPGTSQRYEPFELNPAPLKYDKTMAPMGCIPVDMNEDGLMDILVYYWGRPPVLFMHKNTPKGDPLSANVYIPQDITDSSQRWFTNAATIADLDGDGHLDLVITNYFPDGSHILDKNSTTPDTMQHSMSHAQNGGTIHVFQWKNATKGEKPSVQLDEIKDAIPPEAQNGWALAVGAQDFDNDMLPELYIANDFGHDRFLHNESKKGLIKFRLLQGQQSFTTLKSNVIGKDSFKGMGVDFGDLNGDGRTDIFVSNIADSYALLESHFAFINTGHPELMKDGIAPFENQSEKLGLSRSSWSWDAKIGDFNNDGVPEIVQATGFVSGQTNRWPELQELAIGNDQLLSNPYNWPLIQDGDDLSGHVHPAFFVKDANGEYWDLAKEVGLGRTEISRGIATADVNGDGKLDLAIANQWDRSYFYMNTSTKSGKSIGLHLLLPVNATTDFTVLPGNPPVKLLASPAIGAKAEVTLPTGKVITAEVDGGSGHSGKRSNDLMFGVGNVSNDSKFTVKLTWRDRNGQIHNKTIETTPGWHTVLLGTI